MNVERNLREHAWEILDEAVSDALTRRGRLEGLPEVGWALLSDGESPRIEGLVWGEGLSAYRDAHAWMEVLGGRWSWTGPDQRFEGSWYYWSEICGLQIALRLPAVVESVSI